MPSEGETQGQAPSLFPEIEGTGRSPSVNLRQAAGLFRVQAETTSTDEEHPRVRDLQTGDLFAWGARQAQVRLRAASPGVVQGGRARTGLLSRPSDPTPHGRSAGLGRCLDGGALRVSAGHRRRVLRNRILFVLIVLGISLYVVLRIALRG